MKRLLLVLVTLFALMIGINSVNASSKVTVYLFRGSTCEHCESALEYMDKHRDDIPENIEIVTYEVWDNKNNSKLQDLVADKLNVDKSKNYGVPFIVIGEKYIKGYAGATTFREIIEIAQNYVEDANYKDIVEEIKKENKLEVSKTTLDDLFSKPNKVVTTIIYSIFGIAILGFIALIAFSRKH